MTAARLYGKANGNGPWHLMPARDATRSLCGRRARYHGGQLPYHNGMAARVCPTCRTTERKTA